NRLVDSAHTSGGNVPLHLVAADADGRASALCGRFRGHDPPLSQGKAAVSGVARTPELSGLKPAHYIARAQRASTKPAWHTGCTRQLLQEALAEGDRPHDHSGDGV